MTATVRVAYGCLVRRDSNQTVFRWYSRPFLAQMPSPTATRPRVSNLRFSIAPPDNVLARDRYAFRETRIQIVQMRETLERFGSPLWVGDLLGKAPPLGLQHELEHL